MPWKRLRLRALVLAAGLGTRLRPLTDGRPKPLLPVLGRPILAHTLDRLAAVGCEAVAINLHYLGSSIRKTLGESFAGIPLVYSDEPEALGTLGAFPPLREFFAPADLVLLVNGDSLCRWPLDRLLRRHLADRTEATLLLASRPDPASFGGGVAIDRSGSVLAFRGSDPVPYPVARRHVFAGAHVFAPALVAQVAPGFADIVRDLYMPLLRAGRRIGSVVTARPWHDLGTPRRFLEASLDWASRAGGEEGSWRGAETTLAPGSAVEGSVLEAGVVVEEGARVERSVLLPGARIGRNCRLREVLVGPGVELPPGTEAERRLVVASVGGSELRSAPLDPA